MYSFFILGEIPGTNVTISFSMWMALCAVALLIAALVMINRRQTMEAAITPTIASDENPLTEQPA